MKSAGKARSNGLYRHIRTSKEIIRNLLNDSFQFLNFYKTYTKTPVSEMLSLTGEMMIHIFLQKLSSTEFTSCLIAFHKFFNFFESEICFRFDIP